MARRKNDFSNIVEESFNDGYISEPDVEVTIQEPKKDEANPVPAEDNVAEVVEETVTPPAEETDETTSEQNTEEPAVDDASVDATPEEEVVVEENVAEVVVETVTEEVEEPEEELTESEILLKRLTDGDEELLGNLLYKPERKTYYFTGLQRACIEIMAREEALTRNEVLNKMFDKFFSDAIKEAAKEEVVRVEIKILKRQIEEEKKNR